MKQVTETMKVRIVKCSTITFHYHDLIGHIVDVYTENELRYGVGDENNPLYVYKEDCEIVEKESHMDTSGIVLNREIERQEKL